jgi:predicted alpha/beta hydrolase family esterase
MQYLILHGTFGSAQGNWFPWLKDQLEAFDHKVIIPQFPIEDYDLMSKTGESYVCQQQNLQNWLKYFTENVLPQIKKSDEELCIVAHSLAPVFVLHLIRKFGLKVKLAIFVSPFLSLHIQGDWQYNKINKDFFTAAFDFEDLRSHIGTAIVFYGDNDPYVPMATALEFANKLGAQVISVHDGGHLNAEFGYTSFPQVLEEIIKVENS